MKVIFKFFLFLLSFNLFGQTHKINFDKKVYPQNLTKIKVNDFFETQKSELGLNEFSDMVLVYENVDKNLNIHYKYQQYYKKLEVIGGVYLLHSNNSFVAKSSGLIYPNINIDIKPILSNESAEYLAKEYLKDVVKDNTVLENIIFENKGLYIIDAKYPQSSGDFRLVYSIILKNNTLSRPLKRRFYIDAKNGEMILSYSEINDVTVPGKGKSLYYGEVNIPTDSISQNEYILRDLSRGQGVFVKSVWNNKNEFFDYDNYWEFEDEGENSAIDAYYCSIAYYDLLKEKFGRNSIDGNGFPLVSKVNIKSFVNAYWDGESSTFGSGNCNKYGPLTDLATVGHEFTHGLTGFTSGLIYWDESGALNESISDIFGESLEYFRDSSNFDWIVGTHFLRKSSSTPFRSMSNPNSLDLPNYYRGEYWSYNYFDNLGVHTNSSIFNYWFYLLCEGKYGINEKGDTFDVKAIGINDALDLVYQLQVNYLTPSSDFKDAFNYSISAVNDLFGINSIEMNSIIEAWKAIGIPKNLTKPEVEVEVDSVNFDILYNGQKDSFNKFCSDEFNEFEIEFVNKSLFDYPENSKTELSIVVVSFDKNLNAPKSSLVHLDTFYFENILKQGLKIDSSISYVISIDTIGYNLKHDFFALDIDLIFNADSSTWKFHEFGNINFKDVDEDYFCNLSMRSLNTCDGELNVDGFNIFLSNRGCENISNEDSLIVNFSSNDYEALVKFRLNPFFSSIFVSNIQDSFNFNSLGDLYDYNIDIILKNNERSILVLSDSLKNYIKIPLDSTMIIDFNDETYSSFLRINKHGLYCSEELFNGRLKIGSKWRRSGDIETCLSNRDYFKNEIMNESSFLTDISFCTDIEDLINPKLKFSLKMQDIKKYSDTENNYFHMLRVYQGDTEVDYPIISNTNDEYMSIEIPLNKEYSSNIKMKLLTIGTFILLDDIRIVGDNGVRTENVKIENSFIINNPISDKLIIKSENDYLKWDFELIDVNGNRVFYSKNNSKNLFANVNNLISGVYFYKIVSKNRVVSTGKVIVID